MTSECIIRNEDFVECFIIPLNDFTFQDFDKLYREIIATIIDLSKNHIWHKDKFKIYKKVHNNNVPLNENDNGLPSHMYGICHFGDNIEDEWFIVFIIKEITRKFHNVIAKINDSDGEFLLIEAANSLPTWAEPDICENRVYFHKGSLLMIPPEDNDDKKILTVDEALCRIKNDNQHLTVSDAILNDINQRILHYPEKINELLHRTSVFVPIGVATLLKQKPDLIAPAVHAFCDRDPIDMKACHAMKYFPPENRVYTSVIFTKCLYAMLMHNTFYPDRKIGWNLPLPNTLEYKAHILGVKLACGFEILISQAKPQNDIKFDKNWEIYLDGLKKRNYFQNLLEHSQQYNVLLENAKEYFLNNIEPIKMSSFIGTKISNLLNELDIDESVFQNSEKSLPADDDDEWLSIDPKILENMLEQRYGKKKFSSVNDEASSSQLNKKIKEFLNNVSSIDGVEFPSENDRDNIKKEVKKKSNFDTHEYNGIDFDVDQFSNALKNVLSLNIPEDNWTSESDSSCYGSEDIDSGDDLFENKLSKKKNTMKNYMKKMDKELSSTAIGKSFNMTNDGNVTDIEKNTFSNIKESYEGEAGGTGAAGNILGPLGFTKLSTNIMDEVD